MRRYSSLSLNRCRRPCGEVWNVVTYNLFRVIVRSATKGSIKKALEIIHSQIIGKPSDEGMPFLIILICKINAIAKAPIELDCHQLRSIGKMCISFVCTHERKYITCKPTTIQSSKSASFSSRSALLQQVRHCWHSARLTSAWR